MANMYSPVGGQTRRPGEVHTQDYSRGGVVNPRYRKSDVDSTGQEAFRPGGSGDPDKIGRGFLTGQSTPDKPNLPSYGGVAPGVQDRNRATNPGGVTTRGGWRPVNPPQGTPEDPLVYAYGGRPPQPGFLTGGNANQYLPPQTTPSTQFQGQAQGGQPPAPSSSRPTWNPQGDPTTWGNQYNQYQRQLNEYNSVQGGGMTQAQAQAEQDRLNRASGTDPQAALRRTAGGGVDMTNWKSTGYINPMSPQGQSMLEQGRQNMLRAPAPYIPPGPTPPNAYGTLPGEFANDYWYVNGAKVPNPLQQVAVGRDQANDFAQRSRDIASGAWINPNLNPGAGPRRDVGAGAWGGGGGSFTRPMNPVNPAPVMQPILPPASAPQAPGSGFGTKFLPMPNQPTTPTPPPTTEPGFRETGPGIVPATGGGGAGPSTLKPDFLTGRKETFESVPVTNRNENVPIALPQLSADGVTKGVKDYFLPTEKDEFETEAERLRKNYYVDVPGVLGSAMEEAASRGQLDSGIANRIQMRMLQDRTGQLDRDLMQVATARAAARRQASQRLGEFGLAEGSARNREGFAAQQAALGRNAAREMPGIEGNVQAGLTEQRYGLEGAEAEKARAASISEAAKGRNLQRELIEKQTGAEKELIGARTGSQLDVIREQGTQQRTGMQEQTAQQRLGNLYQADYAAAVNQGAQYSQMPPDQIERQIRTVMDHPTLSQEQKLGFMAGLRKAQYDRGNLEYTRQQETADRDFKIYAEDWFNRGKSYAGAEIPPELEAAARAQGGVAELLLHSGQSGANFDVEFAKMKTGDGRFGNKTWLDTAGQVLDLGGKAVALASGAGGLFSGGPKAPAPKTPA